MAPYSVTITRRVFRDRNADWAAMGVANKPRAYTWGDLCGAFAAPFYHVLAESIDGAPPGFRRNPLR